MFRRASILVLTTLLLAGCTANAPGGAGAETSLTVTASDTGCQLSATTAPAGNVVFTVTNTGSQATEFYLYAGDGQQVVAEVEDIGPGLTRDLAVDVTAGTYVTACKPGMTGDGIRAGFTVTEAGGSASG